MRILVAEEPIAGALLLTMNTHSNGAVKSTSGRKATRLRNQKDKIMNDALMQVIATLFSAIAAISGEPIGDVLPDVHLVPHTQIEAMACPGMTSCRIRAIYIPHLGIYMDDNLDLEKDPFARSILLHELVHHAQAVMAKYEDLSICEAWKASEIEAYEIQSTYLHRVGSATQLPRGITQMLHCPTPESK